MKRLKNLLPHLGYTTKYKGQNGKVAVFGGSEKYTGAPYYAAMSALRAGADLSHVITPVESAVAPIKGYSPELIVHWIKEPADWKHLLPMINSLVVGPGLGREKSVLPFLDACKILTEKQCFVGDADFLWHLHESQDL